ncbi:S9 family peptidase [Ideonella margarita]|uniref:Alpha/beta fold hydrolase n=1 Tax=Ideonella margarita TaxID=2984191 RepID=A0ABU9C7Z0_9BURK
MRQLLVLSLAVMASACSTIAAPPAPTTAPTTALIQPNANLRAEGIPPIPATLAAALAKYNDFRGHSLVDWHPQRREMLVAHRKQGASTSQIYRLTGPMAEAEQLTDFADPVTRASYEPNDGNYVVFERASGGNEVAQLYRLDLATRAVTLLSDPDLRHSLQTWTHGKPAQMVSTAVPLDRTATGGTRAEVNTTIWLTDPLQPAGRKLVATLPGGGWGVDALSADDRTLALQRYVSANESEVWLMDVASGQRRQLLPAAGDKTPAAYDAAGFLPDGKSLLVVTDRDGEFKALNKVDLSTGQRQRVEPLLDWDLSVGSLSKDGRLAALRSNEDGLGRLRLLDTRTLKELPAPTLPAGAAGGALFRRGSQELGFAVNSSAGPGQVFSLDASTGQAVQWTRASAAPGIDPSRFAPQQVVRWTSFDGRQISGLLSQPPARFTGKRPVFIDIHGGPEGQSSIGFMGRMNYLLEELGVAIIRPNVRGSTGYGKTFLALDNGFKREDSVKDIGALLDWIKTQPQLDADRVLVSGGSYGGYMSLAVATHYSDRIAGAIDVVGISHFVTFLNNTESYRRDLRRVEYGDERDPAMRAFQERISPLTNAGKITKPLFVVQGRNDPRVPWTEADQIVQKVRANGTPVWYLLAENEGHGFARKENADFQFYATVMFIQQTLKP